MMKIRLFLGLVAMASILFNKVSAKPLIIKSEYEFAMKHDSIKLSEYIKNLETVAGFKLNPNQIKGAWNLKNCWDFFAVKSTILV